MRIGQRIKSVRESVEMTQRAFAKAVGVSYNYISELEAGKKKPSNLFLLALEYKFGVNSRWVREGKGEKYVGEKLKLTGKEIEIVKAFRGMPKDTKQIIKSLMTKLKTK